MTLTVLPGNFKEKTDASDSVLMLRFFGFSQGCLGVGEPSRVSCRVASGGRAASPLLSLT
ncbi:hypothetical protein [Zavarzinella formosa]|uniref:hypothetical protein n=1 Tax=Zavarzinella formosa TaxID=360055 RepID=UPI0012FBC8BA|nr:hypothetical protein [Zavarzinella formosa]